MPAAKRQWLPISSGELQRRYKNIRSAMVKENIDALIVCGSEYTGFEGAVRYVSDFEIVHRYVYVLIPLDGEPFLVFPREARWIGDKKSASPGEGVGGRSGRVAPGTRRIPAMETRRRVWNGIHHDGARLQSAFRRNVV